MDLALAALPTQKQKQRVSSGTKRTFAEMQASDNHRRKMEKAFADEDVDSSHRKSSGE